MKNKNLPLKNSKSSSSGHDSRVPFAICTVEGLLFLVLFTLLSVFKPEKSWIYGILLSVAYLVIAGATFVIYTLRFAVNEKAESTAEYLNTDIYRMFRTVIDIPYAVLTGDGSVKVINSALQDILGVRSSVCNIPLRDICPSVDMAQIITGAKNRAPSEADVAVALPSSSENEGNITVRLIDGKRYFLESYMFRQRTETYYFVVFRDVNDYLDHMDKTNREHIVVAYIELDNLQELTQFVRANYRTTANLIERKLTDWVASMNGMLREYDRDKYIAMFSEEALDECIKNNFKILNDIMQINVGDNSFPISVSMGIADVDGPMQEREKLASAALEIALQRGGNQVALNRRGKNGMQFFGGAHKTLESNTSITSRVSANLIERQLQHCDNVLIMGHANPDFDSVGSCVGAYRLSKSILIAQGRPNVPVNIIINKECDTFRTCAAHLAAVPEYDTVFIDRTTSQTKITSKTVLIICDVNNPVIFEAPQVVSCIATVDGTASIAVIDHHRLVKELPFTPFLHYIKAAKSSASEIMAEILEQSNYADTLLKEEANLLLAGIMLDTHNFTRSAGAQTFEVAYYLYSRNAHTNTAREFFNEKIDELLVASDFDSHTQIYEKIFAITWLSDDHDPTPEDRIAASKAADKLLGVRGIEASFALAVINNNVIISGRSKGRINVQLILEKLEGGGHFDMAGAQVNNSTVEEAYELLCGAIDEYKLQFPEQFM